VSIPNAVSDVKEEEEEEEETCPPLSIYLKTSQLIVVA
jgi:hypothetical protein